MCPILAFFSFFVSVVDIFETLSSEHHYPSLQSFCFLQKALIFFSSGLTIPPETIKSKLTNIGQVQQGSICKPAILNLYCTLESPREFKKYWCLGFCPKI
jgi:hypothetical protein